MDFTEDNREFVVRQGRVGLMLKASILSIPIKDMDIIQTATVNTISTDGASIFYNPDYIDEIIKRGNAVKPAQHGVKKIAQKAHNKLLSELRWRLGHIAVHIGFGHLANMEGHDKDVWNAACDVFADNLLERFNKYYSRKRGYYDIEMEFNAPENSSVMKEYEDMGVEQIYKLFRVMPESIPSRGIDEHYEWNPESQGVWACKINQAYNYWELNFKDDKPLAEIGAFIKLHLPEISEDQADAWQMMQQLSEIEFLSSYSHYTDEEVKSALVRLQGRSPEDFTIIAARMARDPELRQKMLKCPEWLRASMIHRSYIM